MARLNITYKKSLLGSGKVSGDFLVFVNGVEIGMYDTEDNFLSMGIGNVEVLNAVAASVRKKFKVKTPTIELDDLKEDEDYLLSVVK